ncbi:hypothetical protein MLD38_031489 [Melastoma candidum]|uniref:Uncharacterized protein n=4 Tax=Melastoma candidum TaxID=119954 RepID=A0ACB9MRQ6_9MYRT|nr:hypothetical protein MLD38_031486 [Melastoma candidum]KAI4326147.1 hypothetical protein MLD38_031487 [Melastoma candidum]KAI4326148.1 hypothetical protein MLD38_031488 [Melastoma candidum]KAI4326149.1 hypothetical protein MLD38_031489 [Melastoma candidum]
MASPPQRIPYPPCISQGCQDHKCCGGGYKSQWPELVGKDGIYAKQVIEKDNPIVNVLLIPFGSAVIFDFCCNRVHVFLDQNFNVLKTPRIG